MKTKRVLISKEQKAYIKEEKTQRRAEFDRKPSFIGNIANRAKNYAGLD